MHALLVAAQVGNTGCTTLGALMASRKITSSSTHTRSYSISASAGSHARGRHISTQQTRDPHLPIPHLQLHLLLLLLLLLLLRHLLLRHLQLLLLRHLHHLPLPLSVTLPRAAMCALHAANLTSKIPPIARCVCRVSALQCVCLPRAAPSALHVASRTSTTKLIATSALKLSVANEPPTAMLLVRN